MKRTRIWPVLLASVIGLAILCSLGIWQVQRLAWKQGLIAELDQRLSAPPLTLQAALQRLGDKQDIENLHIRTTGHYVQQAPLHRISTHQSGPGYELLQPFISDDGTFVLVNRGTISTDDQQPVRVDENSLTIEGVARRHNQGRGLFDGDNDIEGNLWVWWDVPEMLAVANPPSDKMIAPFILQIIPGANMPDRPLVSAAKAELRNNHLGYAITWFGLAAALLVITAVFVFRLRK